MAKKTKKTSTKKTGAKKSSTKKTLYVKVEGKTGVSFRKVK